MVERVEVQVEETGPEAPTPPTTTEERPAWLPEKFKTPEDMAKAYSELEQKQGAGVKPDAAAETGKEGEQPKGDEPETDPLKITKDAAQEAVENAGLNFDEFSGEYAKDGKLSDASYEKLAAKGISKEIVDSYIEGQQALVQQTRNDVFKTVGGETNYKAMAAWAAQNVDAKELNAFNAAIDSGNMDATKLAVAGLYSKFVAANGSEPNLLNTGGAPTEDVFRSTAELVSAMSDARYKTDEAYREDVARRLARSTVI